MRRGKRFVIQAERLDPSGAGVGRYERWTVMAGDLLPGESAEVIVEHASPHRPVAWARVVERVGPRSPDRVPPACPGFGECGGCVWQHLAYAAQLEHKQRTVAEAMAAALDPAPEVSPIIGAPAELGYRNKGKYVVGDAPDGSIRLGAYSPRSHRLVDTLGCQVVEPVVDRAARKVRDALTDSGLSVYSERSHSGELRYVLIRASAGRALVALVTTSKTPPEPLRAVASELCDAEITGVVWVRNDLTSGALLTDDVELLAGEPALSVPMSGSVVRVGAAEFLQVNTSQAARLYGAVVDAAQAGEQTRAVDLYCGVGGISFALAAHGARVTGIEQNRRSVDAAKDAAARAGLDDHVTFHAGDAADLEALVPGGDVDLIVVNPPRKGLSEAASRAVARLAGRTLAYVSCGPASLARDLALFGDVGYSIVSVQPFDLMPGTPQVETLAVLRLY